MLLCKRTGFAFNTTKISAGKNSSALAGPAEPCFSRVKIFLQLRTIQSSFSCGDGYESMEINSTNTEAKNYGRNGANQKQNPNKLNELTID